MKHALAILLCCLLLGCSDEPTTIPGSCADLFAGAKFTDPEGREARIACQGYKVLVVNFWAPWCGPCKIEIPHLVEISQQYAEKGVRVAGISLDDTAVYLKEAVAKYKMSYTVLAGGAEEVFARTGLTGIPATLIFSEDGKVYRVLVGYHSKEEMLVPIRELLGGTVK